VDLAAGADHFGKIHRGKAWPRAEIDDVAAVADAGAGPGVERARSPDPMLEPEAINLVIVRAEDVVAFSHLGPPRRI